MMQTIKYIIAPIPLNPAITNHTKPLNFIYFTLLLDRFLLDTNQRFLYKLFEEQQFGRCQLTSELLC